ncbi:MAG: fibronectin type III domain-containing protein, partial [Bacteroidales bacterium]|nr:fibronectin type III domain-containing protein [Bacteroidales bacterium]
RIISLTPEGGVTRLIAQSRTKDTVVVKDLQEETVYVAKTRAVCDNDSSDWSEPITFKTVDSFNIMLRIQPTANAGTVTGAGRYEKGQKATITATPNEGYTFVAWLHGNDTLSKEATHTVNVTASVTYTALFYDNVANEAAVKAAFSVSTKDGHLLIRNLKGLG